MLTISCFSWKEFCKT